MASQGEQQTWVPYQPTKDCSQGFCSIYCPQWCYVVFPPPPPFSFAPDDDDDDSSPTFSPLVIAIIGILASALLLVAYYTIVSRYCGGIHFLRSRTNIGADDDDGDDADVEGGGGPHHDSWRAALSDGLEDSVIRAIAVCKYKKGDGFVDGTDCPVCLAEFKEGEGLRLLPKCSHAFHLHCIDTWLKSHSNCPICRSIVISPIAPPMRSSEEQEREQPPATPRVPNETSVLVDEESNGSTAVPKDPRRAEDEEPDGVVEIGDDRLRPQRSLSIGSGEGPSSSRTEGEESRRTRNKALHTVMSPVPMKRSSGRPRLQEQHASGWGEQP